MPRHDMRREQPRCPGDRFVFQSPPGHRLAAPAQCRHATSFLNQLLVQYRLMPWGDDPAGAGKHLACPPP